MTAAMLRSVLRRSASSTTPSSYFFARSFSSAPAERKVTILGAAGGAANRYALYDIAATSADGSRINTRSEVRLGKHELKNSVEKGVMWHSKSEPDTTILSVHEPMRPTFRPLSPHLPIYKPQMSSTVSIFNRMTGVILTVFPLSYCVLCLKVGPVGLTYEGVYDLFYYSSKLGPISLELSGLAMAYHTYHGFQHLIQLFRGKV